MLNLYIYIYLYYLYLFILGVVKRNPLFLHEIEWKNNGFLFTTPNIKQCKLQDSIISISRTLNSITVKLLNISLRMRSTLTLPCKGTYL